jgi:tRNA(Arg) A34 adenosine deaminase TadA
VGKREQYESQKMKSKFFDLAIKIAKTRCPLRYNFVSVVTDKKDRILSIGLNSFSKTHPTQARLAKLSGQGDKIYLHAEIDALVRCKSKPDSIYVVRLNCKGQIRPAEPCVICRMAIKESNMRNIYHT